MDIIFWRMRSKKNKPAINVEWIWSSLVIFWTDFKISSAFQWITQLNHSRSNQKQQSENMPYLPENQGQIAFCDHNIYFFFFITKKSFSIRFQCWWAQCLPEMVGMQETSREVRSSVVSCWNTICLLPCSDLCRDLHSSVLLHFTSISGWRREESLWQVDLGLLPQPEMTPSFWGDLCSSLVAACL